jgi:protein-arginine kinase activator protein McsA
MLCDACQEREATVVQSRVVSGEKTVIYRCEVCSSDREPVKSADPAPALERPCAKCRKAEGDVKLTRFVNGRRVATFLCQECASA